MLNLFYDGLEMLRISKANYKINNKEDKVGVYVSIVSTKIPFKGTGKEYISNDVKEIKDVVEKAIKACGTQLKVKIAKKQKEKDQASRRKELEKYIKGRRKPYLPSHPPPLPSPQLPTECDRELGPMC